VAELAEVSQMTVSRYLRAPETVSAKTRKRIAEAMRQIGYVPNRLAGALASNKTNLICLIAADLRNPTLAATVQGVCDAVGEKDFQILMAMGGRSPATEEKAVMECLAHRPCGMLIHNTTHTAMTRRVLSAAAIPIVEVGNLTRRPVDSVVSYSNFDAIVTLTAHLRRKYERIAFVGLPARYGDRARARRDGYVAAMEGSGVTPPRDWIVEAPDKARGDAILSELIARAPELQAVIFAGGDLAYEAALERRRRGWENSGRIAIAAYDGTLVRSMPNIVSLDIPRYDIGRKALEVILDRLQGKTAAPQRIEFPFQIIEG